MGYDLHITRRRNWSGKGQNISAEEWLSYVRRDPELRLQPVNGPYFAIWFGASQISEPWLDWSHGQIYSKYPDPALIDKMIAIAGEFGATVQGDDGELYSGGSLPPQQPTLTLRERAAGYFRRLLSARASEVEHLPTPFGVGDKVCDRCGREYTVIEIDPTASHGAGIIRVRRDDGLELGYLMMAHDLKPVHSGGTD